MNSFLLCIALFPAIAIAAYSAYRLFPGFFKSGSKTSAVPKVEIPHMDDFDQDDFDTSNSKNGWYVSTNPMFRDKILFDRWENQ